MASFFDKIKMAFLCFFDKNKARRQALRKAVPENLDEFFNGKDFIVNKIISSVDSHYSIFFLWKDQAKTKKRQIEAPDADLKLLQRIILHKFLYSFASSPHSHGFVRKRSIVSNAACHTGKKFVVKLDLKDFFPSVTKEMIWNEWQNCGIVSPKNEQTLSTLLRLCLYKNRLPQGAPTSPALANIVCRKLDYTLAKFAKKHRMKYSRYADDLTFSCDSEACYKLIPLIKKIVAGYGFKVNEKKVNVLKCHQRQSVTGLIVNHAGHTGVKRRTRMKLRAYMHQIITGKIPLDQVNMQKLRGHISFMLHADPRHGAFFAEQLKTIERMS